MTQVTLLRNQLLAGNSVTQRSALLDFGIMALPRRIADLKELGFPVESRMKTNPMTGQRYKEYRMKTRINSIYEMERNCVYRVVSGTVPFSASALEASQGYFRFERRTGDAAVLVFAGIDQICGDFWLREGFVEVEYVGGMV